MNSEQIIAANGLNMLFIDVPGSSMGSIQIWFRAGSALEGPGNEGIAHFLEHMFFKGSEQRSGDDIAREVESFGGELNAFTSFDYTCYYINTPGSHLTQAVDILMDMVSHPKFKEEELIPEKDVVFEEYLGSLDDPNSYAFYQLQKSCFDQGYTHPILGNAKSIKNFHREQLLNFRKKFYNRNNSLLVVAGDLKKKNEIIDMMKNYRMPTGKSNTFPVFQLHATPRIDVHAKDVHHCQLNIAIESADYNQPDAPAEDLAISCLGCGESSILYKSMIARDTLADQATASTMFMNKGGFHQIKIIFPHDNLNKVLIRIKDILLKISANGFSHTDVNKIKNQYLDSKIYDQESLESFSFSRGQDYAQTGNANSEDEYLERIKNAACYRVNQSLKNIFMRPLHIGLQIPQGENVSNAKKLLSSLSKKLNDNKKQKNRQASNPITRSKFDPKVTKTIIKEGISLLHRFNPLSPTFVLHAYISSGHSCETQNTQGAHNLIAQLITRGYDGIPLTKLKESIENVSASLNGFAGRNAYGLTLHGQTRHFDELFEHFSGCLLSSDMKPSEMRHFKQLFVRTLKKRKKDPYKICFKTVEKIMFPNHPYSQEALGSPTQLKKISRQDLLSLHHENISQKNILISCFGAIEYDQALSTLSPLFSSLKSRSYHFKKRICKAEKNRTIHVPLQREQIHFFTGIPVGGFHLKENIYLKILTTHLSRFSSELFKNLREKQGLCYSSYPVHFPALESGYWGLYVASSVGKADSAIKCLKEIIAQLKENGISENNFNTAKTIIEGKEMLNLQTNEDYANIYSITALHKYNLDFHHKELATIKNLTFKDFQVQLAKTLSKKWNDVYVGP